MREAEHALDGHGAGNGRKRWFRRGSCIPEHDEILLRADDQVERAVPVNVVESRGTPRAHRNPIQNVGATFK
jgi:hypothetical protein